MATLRLLDPTAPTGRILDSRVGERDYVDAAQADAAGGNSFTNAFTGARLGNQANQLADEESVLRTSSNPADQLKADELASQRAGLKLRGQAYAPAVGRYEDVHSLSDAGSYVAGQLGQGLGSSVDQMATGAGMNALASGLQMIPTLPTRLAGTALRYAAPAEMYRQNKNLLTGEAYDSVSEDPTVMANRSAQDIRDEVSKHGYRAAVMDTLPQLLPVGQVTGTLGKVAKKVPAWGKLAGEAVGEGVTEAGQQISQHYAHEALNPNRDTSGDVSENINSALGGAIGGGGMGAIGHLGEKAWDRGRTVGDGKNGDVLNLNGTPTPSPAKPSVLETLNGRPSKFTRRAEAQKYADILSGSPADGVDANAQWMEENGPVRKSALLAELAKRKEPEAAAHAAEVSAVDDKDPMAVMDPRMDAASEWLLPKLHLTNAEVSQMKRNAERVSSTDLGSRAGAGGTAEFEKLMLPDGAREKMGDVKFAAAQAEVKAHGQTAKLLADRLWSAFGTNKEGKPNLDDRELVQGLAQEVMAAATVDKPTEEEARRAQRLGEHLVRVVGPEAVPVLQGLTRTGGSTLLDHVIARATGVASMGSGLSHKQEQLSRTEAAVAFTNLVPPTVERRLLNDHGIDLNDEKDQNDLLDLVEDFHDGRSNVTLMRLNKLLTAPVVKAMGLYLGNKIQPRLRGEEAVAQEHTSGATKTTDADTEGTSGGKLISGELMGEQSEAPSEYEAVGQEKSMDRVMPESMVFHHSGNKDGSVRDIKDAWKEDAKGELPQLLREGTGAPLLDRVKKLAQQAAAHLGNSRDRYVIGDPASKDPLVAAGATSAKKLMDDTGMPDSKRAQLLFRYLAKENKDLDVGELEDMHKSVAYLGQLDRALTSTVTNRESLSPSGEKLSIPHSAEINAPHIDYEKLADLAANPSDAAKVKELFKAGTISKYVGLAQIVRRAKAAAEQYLTTLPGYSEFVSKAEAADGRTPEFHEYVNDFFSQHHVVVAEQPTNRDHLQMSLPEFREMAMKGKANLKSAELAVVGSSMNDKARESERLRVEASMNLIRFKSSHSRSVDGEVYLPAHMLVAWVRKMRNAHETDGKNAPTKSNSPTKQTEDYKRDLMEGITTVMQNDLTDGLPWIINSTGKREDFTETALHAKPGDPTQRQLFNDGNGRNPPDHGSLPPSLDLDGITAEDADASRASGAKKRREAEEAHTASQSSLNAERGLAEEEERKNAELGQDDRDVQDADSVAAAEAEANGSKTREEERANLKFMSSVMGAAADKGPRPLTVGGAMNYAGRVADELWRSYIGGERKEALARIMSYVRATDKERYDEDASNDAHIMEGLWAEYNKAEEGSDEQDAVLKRIEEQAATTNSGKQTTTAAVGSGLVGGQQYNFPLAALLTPRHMASLNPKDVAVMTMLRSRVASELLGMFHAKQISGGNLGKLVNFLSGYTDKTSQDMLDKKNPPDADLIKNRTPWQSTRIYQAGREGFLAAMAKPYQEMVTKRGPAVAKDVLGWVGHPTTAFGLNLNGAPTEGSSSGEPLVVAKPAKKVALTTADQVAQKEAEKGNYQSLGVARTADTSISDEQAAEETADVNADVDKLAKVIGNSLDARKAGVMGQKAEATTLETLPDAPQAPGHAQVKEAAKLAGADLVLAPVSAEKGFAGKLARWAKGAGRLVGAKPAGLAGKVVYVSVPGATRGWTNIDTLIARAKMALDAGATLRTDNEVNANSSHNRTGEGALRAALIDGGYVETPGEAYSTWVKGEAKAAPLNIWYGSNENSELSNLAERPFEFNNRDYISVEHAYQSNKSGKFDQATFDKYRWAGKKIPGTLGTKSEGGWNLGLMKRLVSESFKQNPEAAAALKATGDVELTHTQDKGVWATEFPRILTEVRSELAKGAPQERTEPKSAKSSLADKLLEAYEAVNEGDEDRWVRAEHGDKDAVRLVAAFHKAFGELKREVGRLIDEQPAAQAKDLREKLEFVMEDSPEDLVKMYKELTGTKDSDDFRAYTPNAGMKLSSEVLTAPTAEQSAKAAANPPKQLQVTAALAHFKRTLSDQVKVMFADAFPDMTHGADYNTVEHLARISTANPLKIMQLAYHESMHGFFDTVLNAKGHEEIKAMMQGAMSEPKVYARLKDMLRDSPDALADMERDPEERVAYAYQFWAAGMLSIAQTPTTVFQKVQALMRRVFNAVSDNEKALAMFEAFHKGELKEPSAAGKAMLKIMQTGEWKAQFMKRFDKQVQAVYAEVMANHLVGRNSESATARKINNMWYSNPAYGSDTAEDGVINRTQMMRKKYINRLRLALAPLKGPNADRDLKALGEALNAHTTPELAHVAKAKVAVQALLKQYHAYAREAGIDLGERFGTDGDNDYFTRVMDLEKLINGKEEFTSMLMMKYPHVLKPAIGLLQRTAPEGSKITEIDVANAIHQMYIDHNGVDDDKLSAMREDGILNPFFAAQNKRELYWIKDADIAPFLNTDAVGTLTQYISQGVRAAEYARAFGQGGADLKDMMAREGDVQTVDKDGVPTLYTEDGPVASELVAAAEKQGLKGKPAEEWVNRRVDDLRRSHGAYEGSLGKDITAEIRKLQAGAMIYQTLRLLPLMIFSSMLDPNGIRVAGGTSDDMFDAYKRGFSGLWMNWKDMFLGNAFGSRDPDAKEMAALEAGVIDSDMELEEMGQVHSSEYSSGITRHIGHAFFKAIGITQWDRDMRISAVDAARKSIVSSFNNEVPEHSPRWLKEIGLKRDQVFINAGGDLIVSARELALKNSISRAEAAKLLEPTHLAINRWVNRAIVSPNAGLRPTRFSDPHFAMFAQFKSFTYAFQETTLRYAAHEAEQGNFNSGAQLLRGIPIMIAADMTKAMLTGGGSLPGYMANWTMADWVSHAINRSGVGGTGTFATDILSGDIVGTLAGPTVDHAVGTVGKLATGEVGSAITNSIPIVKQLAGGAKHVAAAAI